VIPSLKIELKQKIKNSKIAHIKEKRKIESLTIQNKAEMDQKTQKSKELHLTKKLALLEKASITFAQNLALKKAKLPSRSLPHANNAEGNIQIIKSKNPKIDQLLNYFVFPLNSDH
jgi:hypothetical protein